MHANPQTKETLLDAAQKLMLKKGFTATSVDEICEAAGVTKGSFFHYFESKEELAKAAATRFYESGNTLLQSAPFRKKKDPLDRLYGYIDFFIDMARNPQVPKSCLIGNFTQELAPTNPAIRRVCESCFSLQIEDFKKALDETRAKYLPKAKLDTQSIADHFMAIMEGSLILYKAKQDIKVIENSFKHFRNYVQILFGEKIKGEGNLGEAEE